MKIANPTHPKIVVQWKHFKNNQEKVKPYHEQLKEKGAKPLPIEFYF